VGLDVWIVKFLYEWEGRGGVGVCALRTDAAMMCAVDAMFTCVFLVAVVFLGCCAISVAAVCLLLPYGFNYVYSAFAETRESS
jgi:hypothetical protein